LKNLTKPKIWTFEVFKTHLYIPGLGMPGIWI